MASDTTRKTPSHVKRRTFLATSGAAGLAATGLTAAERLWARSPNAKIVVGVMGLSRGRALMAGFAREPGVVVKYACDVDSQRAERGARTLQGQGKGTPRPQPITDFRRMLDDKEVDVIVNATPNHWHGPGTIFACQAGKHVYVEKPCCHNPQEGEWMIAAARKHHRAVQMGAQRRSGPGWHEAISRLHEGVIGRVYLARSWYNNARGSIGKGKPAPVPDYLNYELWQGPAPRKPYLSNRIHYNWHWFWHWGNGELGNNGVHTLDLCRWGLDVDYPIRVTSSGGRYHFEDDQQTPDTHTVCYEFPGRKQITWEGKSCNRHGSGFVTFYGDGGTMELDQNGSYTIFDARGKKIESKKAPSRGDREHIVNLLTAIRNDTPLKLNAEIEEGHKSTLLCHLGNIAHRTGRTLTCDPANGHIAGDEEAARLWHREYDPKFQPKV